MASGQDPPRRRPAQKAMVSTFAAALLAAMGLSGPSATHAAPPAGGTFFVSGHGWGHGVGLAQYGAYGYALHGWAAGDIVAHYYPGTDLGQAPVRRVRVLLVPGSKSVVVASRSSFTVRDAAGKTHKLPAGRQQLGPGLKLKLAESAKALPGPLVFSAGATPLILGDRAFRGSLRVTGGKSVRVVNSVGLEQYLWGVVPSEMPDTWPAEALKSQAIVARTYALTHLQNGGGDFDVYPDTRSQVYGGLPAESAPARDAVNGTLGQVVLYKGELAQTFFFSSSGGKTANVQDVWGSKATPYLVSVPDPYDTLSPYHDWGPLKFSALQLGKRLGSRGRLLDVHTDAAADGRVRSLTLVGAKGNRTITGSSARAAMGLRSTWFTIGALSLTSPSKPVEYGTETRLVGLARGIPRVTLESRAYGGQWKTLAILKSHGGQVVATLAPKVTTDYRISSGIVRSGVVRLSVAPSVRLTAATDRTSVVGLVKPLLQGAPVQVQRQVKNGTWATVATTKVTADGAFGASVDLSPGAYRARVVAGKGYALGLSPVLTVVPA